MLHSTAIGRRSALRLSISFGAAPGGISTLPPGFFGEPVHLKLWAIGDVFLANKTWPSRRAMACGVNVHVGWSISTFVAGTAFSFGLIVILSPFVAGSSQTN